MPPFSQPLSAVCLAFHTPSQRKERSDCTSLPPHLLSAKSLCFNRNDFTAVVVAASLAGSVRQARLAALRASDDAGDRQFPVGAASLISSRTGYFSLGYCHVVHLLGSNASTAHYLLIYPVTAARQQNGDPASGLQSQGPSLRFLPQRKQMPLQSGLHSSWLSHVEHECRRHDIGPDRRSRPRCRRPTVRHPPARAPAPGPGRPGPDIETARVKRALRSGHTRRAAWCRSRRSAPAHRRCCAPCPLPGPARLPGSSRQTPDRDRSIACLKRNGIAPGVSQGSVLKIQQHNAPPIHNRAMDIISNNRVEVKYFFTKFSKFFLLSCRILYSAPCRVVK